MAIHRLKTALASALSGNRLAATAGAGVPSTAAETVLPFRCNLCGTDNRVPLAQL